MSEQEQTSSSESQVVEQTTIQPESTTAVDTGETQEKITFSEPQQKILNDAVGKKAFEVREQKRENEVLKQQLEDAKANVPQQTRPDVPEMPDQFEDNFNERMALRDKAIADAAAFDSAKVVRQQQQQAVVQQQQAQQQEAYAKSANDYIERATKLGVSQQELQVASQSVVNFGLDLQLQQHILLDDQGPLIATYLAANQQEMLALSTMTPMQAAVMIESQIKPKAIASGKRPPPEAPDPAEHLTGGGQPPKQKGPKGAKYW